MSQTTKKYLYVAVLVLVAGLLYCRSLGNEFMMLWDDQWMVFNPYTSDGFTAENLGRILTEIYYRQYSPLNQLFYTMLHNIAGYNPVIYHGFCILLHVLNVVVAYLFLYSLLISMRASLFPHVAERNSEGMAAKAAFIASLLFAVHPVNVESVSWISASKIVLCSFFYLSGLYLYVKFIRSRSRLTYLIIMLLFALAFGAKEQAVSFVICCMVIDYAVKRKEPLSTLVNEKLPMMYLALFFGFITMMTHWRSGLGRMPEYTGIANRVVLASYSVFEYLVKSLIPWRLSYIYPFPYQPGDAIPLRMWVYPVFAGGVAYAVWLCRRNRLVVVAALFFIANLLLTMHFIPMSRFTVVCDRYLYVALLGPAVLAGWWIAWYLRKCRTATVAFLMFYLLFLSGYSFIYQHRWSSSENLKKEVRKRLRDRKGDVDLSGYVMMDSELRIN